MCRWIALQLLFFLVAALSISIAVLAKDPRAVESDPPLRAPRWQSAAAPARIVHQSILVSETLAASPEQKIEIVHSTVHFRTGDYYAIDCAAGEAAVIGSALEGASIRVAGGTLRIGQSDLTGCSIVLEGDSHLVISSSSGGKIICGDDFCGSIALYHSPGWVLRMEGRGEMRCDGAQWAFPEKRFGAVRMVASGVREYHFTVRENRPLSLENFDNVALALVFERETSENIFEQSAAGAAAQEDPDLIQIVSLRPGVPNKIAAGEIAVDLPGTKILRCEVIAGAQSSVEIDDSFLDIVRAKDEASVAIYNSTLRELFCRDHSGVQVYDSQIAGLVWICEKSQLFLENTYPADYNYENRDSDYYFYLDDRRFEPLSSE